MRVQWFISDAANEWVMKACELSGSPPGAFVERLIRFHAGALDDAGEHALHGTLEALEMVNDIDWEKR